MSRTMTTASVLVAAALSLTACGGGDEATAAPSPDAAVVDGASGGEDLSDFNAPVPAGGPGAQMQDGSRPLLVDESRSTPEATLDSFVKAVAASDFTRACTYMDAIWNGDPSIRCDVFLAKSTDPEELAAGYTIDTTQWDRAGDVIDDLNDSVIGADGRPGAGFGGYQNVSALSNSVLVRNGNVWTLSMG